MNNNKTTFLEALKDEFGFDLTTTENGAYTFKTSNSKLLDLFFKAGALRNEITRGENNKKVNSYNNVSDRVKKIAIDAFKEDEDLTLKILLYSRDILNGMGERIIPRQMIVAIFDYIDSNLINKDNIESYENKFVSLLKGIKDLGRWDDLIEIYYSILTYTYKNSSSFQKFILNEIILTIQTQLLEDISNCDMGKPISLLAKWLPSVNTSSKYTKELAKLIRVNLKLNTEENKHFSAEEYRKTLSKLRKHIKIIENNLREKDYTFDYSKVPSKAMAKYTKAFNRNDKDRFNEYLKGLARGDVKINTKTLTPANICAKIKDMDRKADENEKMLVNEQWKNMIKEFDELNDINAIVACDVSGSMYSGLGEQPINVSIGLALFFAYKATGPFANHFIDFCGKPEIHKIDINNSIIDNYHEVRRSSRDMSTNIDAVFDTLLDAAKNYQAKQEDLPKYLIIISDMEFDQCTDWDPSTEKYQGVNFNSWKRKFKEADYELPTLIFWNVDSRQDISPAQSNENVVFISGRSSNGFKMLNILDKYQITDNNDLAFFVMLKTLERYNIYFDKE